MTDKENDDLLIKALNILGEHFDHVQILVSWNEQSQSRLKKAGSGNWYARQGMAHEFINSDKAQDIAYQLAEKINHKDDDDFSVN